MRKSCNAFTLAELLIALVILGVIATFTIPKVLQSQQDTKYKSMAREVASMLSGAYSAYSRQNSLTAGTKMSEVSPYMNYVRLQTTGNIDYPDGTAAACDATTSKYCIVLHNGGVFRYDSDRIFNTTAATAAIYGYFDPDGQVSSVRSVALYLYYNGRVTSAANILPNTCCVDSTGSYCRDPGSPYGDPSWFDWN